jgi:hypothetical protein
VPGWRIPDGLEDAQHRKNVCSCCRSGKFCEVLRRAAGMADRSLFRMMSSILPIFLLVVVDRCPEQLTLHAAAVYDVIQLDQRETDRRCCSSGLRTNVHRSGRQKQSHQSGVQALSGAPAKLLWDAAPVRSNARLAPLASDQIGGIPENGQMRTRSVDRRKPYCSRKAQGMARGAHGWAVNLRPGRANEDSR